MNLVEIRQAIYDQSDWAPAQTPEINARCDRFINRALHQLVTRVPDLFVREVKIWTQPDTVNDAEVALDVFNGILNGALCWVIEHQMDASTFTWPVDGSWAGRRIEIKDDDDVWHANQIREVWQQAGRPTPVYRISLVRPMPQMTGAEYRIWSPQLWLPPDVIELRFPGYLTNSTGTIEIKHKDKGRRDIRGYDSTWSLREGYETYSTPYYYWEGEQFMLPGPEEEPYVEAGDGEEGGQQWVGPDPAGEFEYRTTYVWGFRDNDSMSPLGYREPRFESPPSPISTSMVVTWNGPSNIITMPAVEWMKDFHWGLGGGTPYARDMRSGLRTRLWRRRKDTATGSTVPFRAVYDTFGWALLHEFEISGNTHTWEDNGSQLVDRGRRLKLSTRNRSVVIWPRPIERSEIKLTAVVRPQPLEHDNDTPEMSDTGVEALISRAARMFYKSMDRSDLARDAHNTASDQEDELVKHASRLVNVNFRRNLSRGGR